MIDPKTAVSQPLAGAETPVLLVELSGDTSWTPLVGRASLTATVTYAADGDVQFSVDEPVMLSHSPALKAAGDVTLSDTSWGLLSRPAYTNYLAAALAEAIAAALEEEFAQVR